MTEAFSTAWSVVKNENSCSKCGNFIHFQDEPFWSAGECRKCWPEGDYDGLDDETRIRMKVRNNVPLDSDERISRVPQGHNWQSFGRRWEGGMGSEVPECDHCSNTVYHAPLKGSYGRGNDVRFCHDPDCIDATHELIGSQGYEEAHEITSDHDEGSRHNVPHGQYETGHVGHQEWDPW